jgi:hypothetical protein
VGEDELEATPEEGEATGEAGGRYRVVEEVRGSGSDVKRPSFTAVEGR